MIGLSTYWPTLPHIDECVRTEAETVDDAVLLAVHEPGPLRVRAANGSTEEMRTEGDLLDALLSPADDGSAIVVAITGDSGVGKSHMVRWLNAQLQRHPDRDRLVIVLVPKTASLRQVVERILAPLRGYAYETLKNDLSRAIDTITPQAASELLGTALAIELERRAKEWHDALRIDGNTANQGARNRIYHARGLRNMLRDGAVFDSWFGKVLLRIVTQTIMGGSVGESGTLRCFTPADLEMPADCDVTQTAQAAQQYIYHLQSHEGVACEVAAAVLQEVLDPALRTVFRFSEALGQRTIEEIVDDIRRQLLAEGKELVLLIEDFAALAGIQQPLLNLMIAESDHEGRRVRAPLRTALAVTDGFLPSRQTILTRAKREWIIPSIGESDTQVVQRMTDLAGRYLNAARWGVDALRDQYTRGGNDDLYKWVQPFQANISSEDAKRLNAFGVSRHGFPLFPLSPLAIRSLCRRELRTGDRLSFNPRTFINQVLRDTLLQRPMYEAGTFPPTGFKGAVLSSNADIALRTQAYPQATNDRLAVVLVYWAGEPADLHTAPQVEPGIFEAFRLPWPFTQQAPQHPNSSNSPTTTVTAAAPQLTEHRVPGTEGLAIQLEEWANGTLPQKAANQIRQIVAKALNDRLDWNSLRMRRVDTPPAWILLPFVPTGNPTSEPKLSVAENVRPVSAVARMGIAALDRWSDNKSSWDYPKADDDYAVAQQLLDSLERQFKFWILESAQREVSVAARTLHRQALMLGLSRKAEPSQPRLSELCAVAATPDVVPVDIDDRSPAGFVATACRKARESRPELQKLLVDSTGCFQGSGQQVYAIDIYRLHAAWKRPETEDDARLFKPDAQLARGAVQELSMMRLPALLNRYRNAIEASQPIVQVAVVEDSGDWVAPLQTLLSTARKMSLVTDKVIINQVNKSLKLLDSEAGQAEVRRALAFTAPEDGRSLDVRLAGWAMLDVWLLSEIASALTTINVLLTSVDREAQAALTAAGGGDTADMLMSLQVSLRTLGETL